MTKKTATPYKEAHKRTVAKAICWRIIATLTTMIIVFLFTRKFILLILYKDSKEEEFSLTLIIHSLRILTP